MSTAQNLQAPASPLRVHHGIENDQLTPASKNKRVIAFLLDALFSGSLSAVLIFALTPLTPNFASTLAQLTLSLFYWVIPTYVFGHTLGKKLLGLTVVRHSGKGDLGVGQILIRETVGRMISALPLLMGYFWVAFNKKHRSWHDMMSNTWVVEK